MITVLKLDETTTSSLLKVWEERDIKIAKASKKLANNLPALNERKNEIRSEAGTKEKSLFGKDKSDEWKVYLKKKNGGSRGSSHTTNRTKRRVAEMTQVLDLDEETTKKLQEVFEEDDAKRIRLSENFKDGGKDEARKEMLKEINGELFRDVRSVLGKEKFDKYKAYVKEKSANIKSSK